jgi:hypothetical protein
MKAIAPISRYVSNYINLHWLFQPDKRFQVCGTVFIHGDLIRDAHDRPFRTNTEVFEVRNYC